MVQGLSTFLGGLNKNGQIVLGLLLADIFPQRLGPQRSLLGVFLQEGLGHNRLLIDVASKINAQSATSLSLRTRRGNVSISLHHLFQALTDDFLQRQAFHVHALERHADFLAGIAKRGEGLCRFGSFCGIGR